jgi:hypothetical protein
MDETPPDVRKDDLFSIRETLTRLEMQIHEVNLQIQRLTDMALEAKALMDSNPVIRMQKAIHRGKRTG